VARYYSNVWICKAHKCIQIPTRDNKAIRQFASAK